MQYEQIKLVAGFFQILPLFIGQTSYAVHKAHEQGPEKPGAVQVLKLYLYRHCYGPLLIANKTYLGTNHGRA